MRTQRKVQLGSAIGAAVAVLLFMAPSAVGAHIVVMTAPYTGVSVSPSTYYSTAGCSRATIHAAPFFHSKVGIGGFAESAASRTCAVTGGSGASASTGFIATVPVKLLHANDSVVAVTLVRAWIVASLVATNCTVTNTSYAYCYQSTYAFLGGYVYLADMTNYAVWYPSHTWAGLYQSHYNDYSCYQGNCSSYSANTNAPSQNRSSFSWGFSVTSAHPADQFAVIVDFYSYTSAYESSYGATMNGARDMAAVNAATLGNEIDLASISIA